MLFLAGAEDMIVLFLGLEVMSVAVYVLAGFDRLPALVGGGGAQVLPDRRVRVGVPALRHRAGLRRHRRDQLHAHRRSGSAPAPRS